MWCSKVQKAKRNNSILLHSSKNISSWPHIWHCCVRIRIVSNYNINFNWKIHNKGLIEVLVDTILQLKYVTATKRSRHRQDSNLRTETAVDFESTSLTTRTRCQQVYHEKNLYLIPLSKIKLQSDCWLGRYLGANKKHNTVTIGWYIANNLRQYSY